MRESDFQTWNHKTVHEAQALKVFSLFGEWNDENSGTLGLKLLCYRCYESAWSEGTHRLLEAD